MTLRIGSQEPRIRIVPDYVATYGSDAVSLAIAYASPLDEWEEDVLNSWLARDEYGKPVAITCGLSVPRQNGKNYCIEIFELFCASVLGWHILHTAHEVKTSMKAFRRVQDYFEGPTSKQELRALVKSIRRTNGQEAIELLNGGVIEFSARSGRAARGFDDIQVLILDEGQEVVPSHVDALNAVLSASSTGTRQVIWTGTPTPPNSPGTVMQRTREQVMSGDLTKAAWHEWSIEKPFEVTAKFEDLIDMVYRTNPAMGIRLDEDFTRQEFATLTPDGFARERLGWWLTLEQSSLIPKDDWMACRIDGDTPHEQVAYGVKFAVDGSIASLSVASRDGDGTPHIEFIEAREGREGTNWLAEWLAERKDKGSCVVIDGLYGRDVLVNDLNQRHLFPKKAIIVPSSADVATAASMLKQRVDTHSLTWYGKQERLANSALRAEKRDIGNRGAWGFGGEDPTPIESCSLALFGLLTTKRKAGRKQRVG